MEHVLQKHWKIWKCPGSCEGSWSSTAGLKLHLQNLHPDIASEKNLDAIIARSERKKPLDEETECELCGENLGSIKQYQRHVGKHQVDLALFALPKIDDGGDSGRIEMSDGSEGEVDDSEVDEEGEADEEEDNSTIASIMYAIEQTSADWKSLSKYLGATYKEKDKKRKVEDVDETWKEDQGQTDDERTSSQPPPEVPTPPAGSDIEPVNSRTLAQPQGRMTSQMSPAPQLLMGQSSSKVSSSTQKIHKCKVCDKRFTRPSSLQTHMYSHTDEKRRLPRCDI